MKKNIVTLWKKVLIFFMKIVKSKKSFSKKEFHLAISSNKLTLKYSTMISKINKCEAIIKFICLII